MKSIILVFSLFVLSACSRIENRQTNQSNTSPAIPNQATSTKPVDPVSYKIIKEEVKNDDILNRSIVDTRILVTGKLTREGLEKTLRDIMTESRSRNMSKIKHPGYISNFIYAY